CRKYLTENLLLTFSQVGVIYRDAQQKQRYVNNKQKARHGTGGTRSLTFQGSIAARYNLMGTTSPEIGDPSITSKRLSVSCSVCWLAPNTPPPFTFTPTWLFLSP